MPQFDNIIQKTSEKIMDDERWRSNMTDREAKMVLDWALDRIQSQVTKATDDAQASQIAQKELGHIRELGAILNGMARSDSAPKLADAVDAVNASLMRGADFSREEIFYLLASLASAAWQIRAD